jgi:dTDP-glucose pyrophosphorylase
LAIAGVIPAAGFASRLQPLKGSKEVLPIAGRPVMDYIVDRMLRGGADELRVVTRPEKADVIAHATELGATIVLARPDSTSESFAAGMKGLANDDVVLIGWPDTLWEPENGYVSLVAAVDAGHEIALGLFETDDLERYDVLDFDDGGHVTGVHIKPAKPPSSWIWGCAAARRGALDGLERHEWPGSFFDSVIRGGVEVHAVRLSNVWLDIGTRDALERARTTPPV